MFFVLLIEFIYRIGFVTQDDVLYPQLTVEETLIFAAFLRLPDSMSERQKYDRVEVILKELGLERLVFNPMTEKNVEVIISIHIDVLLTRFCSYYLKTNKMP